MTDSANASRSPSAGRRLLWTLSALLALGAPGLARAEELCDDKWDGRNYVVEIGERKNDGKPLQPYDPSRPMEPYEVPGERWLFREKKRVYRMVGRFKDRAEAQAALKVVLTEKTWLWTNAYPPFVTTAGAYLVNDAPKCKITRDNPVIDPSTWILEKDGVLLVGTEKSCARGRITKTVTVVSCDGMKNLLTDSVTAPCEASIRTCIHPLAPGVLLFEHYYSAPAQGTQFELRVYDTRKKKRLQSFEWANDGGPEAEIGSVQDIDHDGVPEIVFSIAGTDARTSVRKWSKDKFVEVKSP